MNKEKRYSTGDLAEKFGLSTETIRNYENDFNLNIERNDLNYRSYTEADIKIYKHIIRLKKEGLSTEDINDELYNKFESKYKKEINKRKSRLDTYTVEFESIKKDFEKNIKDSIDNDIKKIIDKESNRIFKKIEKSKIKLKDISEKMKRLNLK